MTVFNPVFFSHLGLTAYAKPPQQLPNVPFERTRKIGPPHFRWDMGHNRVKWIFGRPGIPPEKTFSAKLTQEYISLTDPSTDEIWRLNFDQDGYVLNGEGERYKYRGRPSNALFPKKFHCINFWRAFLTRDPTKGAKLVRPEEFGKRIEEKKPEKVYTLVVPNKKGTIGLKVNGEKIYLWGHGLRYRKGGKVLLVKDEETISIYTSQHKKLYEFYWDKEFNRFYRPLTKNGENVRSYIETVTPKRYFQYGNILFYFHNRTELGNAYLIEMDESGFRRASLARDSGESNRNCPVIPVIRDGEAAGYILSPTTAFDRPIKFTGEILGRTRITLRKGHYHHYAAFGKGYVLPLEKGAWLGLGKIEMVDIIIENNIVTGIRNPKNGRTAYNELVRNKYWRLLSSSGRKHPGIMMLPGGGIIILERRRTYLSKRKDTESIKVGNRLYSLGVRLLPGTRFRPRVVSVVLDLKRPKRSEKFTRVRYWEATPRFELIGRCKAVVTAELPLLPAKKFRDEAKGKRMRLAEDISKMHGTVPDFISDLGKLIMKKKYTAEDVAHIIDIIFMLGHKKDLPAYTYYRSICSELHLLFEQEELNDLWIETFYIMLAHKELREELLSILENARPKAIEYILSQDNVLEEAIAKAKEPLEQDE